MDILLIISCCLLLLLETVITEHARLLAFYEDVKVQEKKELQKEDILKNWGFNQQPVNMVAAPTVVTYQEEIPVYEESQLTDSQASFFQAFEFSEEHLEISEVMPADLMDLPDTRFETFEVEGLSWDELSETREDKQEVLSMEDWEEAVPTTMDKQLSASASHKISDGFIGEQLWVVEVVGYEQNYIHVSDGATRTWLNIGQFQNINKGDILSVLVHRDSNDHLQVTDIDILQKKSTEFAIEIDDVEFEDERLEYAI